MAKLAQRISVDPEQCSGRPCIRGMRIRVTDVLDLLANGLTATQVLKELPNLEQVTEQVAAVLNTARVPHTREELQAMVDCGPECKASSKSSGASQDP